MPGVKSHSREKAEAGPEPTWFSVWCRARLGGPQGPLWLFMCWKACWLGNQSSRLPEPQFPYLEMATLRTSVCLLEFPTLNADWMVSDETCSPSSFQWFWNPGYTQATFSPPCGKWMWDPSAVLAREDLEGSHAIWSSGLCSRVGVRTVK